MYNYLFSMAPQPYCFIISPYAYFSSPHQSLNLQTYPPYAKGENNIEGSSASEGTVSPVKAEEKQPSIQMVPCQKAEQNLRQSEKKEAVKSNQDSIELQNRNILPNTINIILSYLRRINKSGKVVQSIINKLRPPHSNYTVKKFFAYQAYLKNNVNDFINRNALKVLVVHLAPNCPSFSIDQQRFYNAVCRILVRNYLEREYLPTALVSTKLTPSKRRDHLKVQRHLLEIIRGERDN